MYKITAITEEGSVKLKKYLDDWSLEKKGVGVQVRHLH